MTYSALNERSVPFYLYRFRQFVHRLQSFTQHVDKPLLEKRPDDSSWTIAECFSHIVNTDHSYLAPLEKAIDEQSDAHKRVKDYETGFHQRFWIRWFIWLMEPPARLHFKAPRKFGPERGISAGNAIEQLFQVEKEIIELIKNHERMDWSAVKHSHPIIPLLKLNASETLSLLEAHQRRHLQQAIEIHRKLLLDYQTLPHRTIFD